MANELTDEGLEVMAIERGTVARRADRFSTVVHARRIGVTGFDMSYSYGPTN